MERSVSIAALSTRDIVAKDFALDPDEEKLREAAYMMVSGLASGFAIVTCKESLKPTLISGLHAVFVHHGIADVSINKVRGDKRKPRNKIIDFYTYTHL